MPRPRANPSPKKKTLLLRRRGSAAPDHGSLHNLLALGLGISLTLQGRVGERSTPPCVGKNVCPLHGEHGEGETDKTGDTTGAFAIFLTSK